MKVLMIDIGGTTVKLMLSGCDKREKFDSGPQMTPQEVVKRTKPLIKDWQFDAISIGFPGLIIGGRIAKEPGNLGTGWIGFDFESAFDCPARVINDAALQALGNYEGGRMLFFGIGTGIGSTLIIDDTVIPLELGELRFTTETTIADETAARALDRLGHEQWQQNVVTAIRMLQNVFWPTDTVLGGGKAKLLDPFPEGCRCMNNKDALRGAERLWGGRGMVADAQQTSWHIRRVVSKDMML